MRDLDVLTDIGHRTPEGDRAELGYPGGGPQWLITELGVFDYADGHARLRALWPDVTLADVEEATGFDLRVDLVDGLLRTADRGRARRRAGGRPARRPAAGVRPRRAEADVPVRLLNALFSPRRVALVGASDRKGTLGNLLATNLASFPGEVVPVGSGASLRDVEGEIDLAVVAVPAHAVPAVAADAAAKGVAAMVVLSGGFAEIGPDGAKLQAELVANAGATRVIGPNCFGIQNCDLPLNASMAVGPAAGRRRDLPGQPVRARTAWRSTPWPPTSASSSPRSSRPGNTCDVTIAELLGELADDPAAGTLCFLLESLADGRAFVEQARAVTPNRPVVVVKTGKSEAGARAASSHTAALAADTAIWRGVFRQAGIVEVASGQELLDAARALDGHPLPAGPRVAIITNSGGVGVELSDLLADEGLTVPALSAPLQDKIRAMLPPFASPANPVDVTPVWSRFAELYPALTDLLARSGEVDVVVPVLLQRAALDAKTAEGLRDVVAGLRADDVRVPVHVCWVAPRDARPNADLLQDAGVPCFDWPARTARAIGHARRYAVARARTTPAARSPVGAVGRYAHRSGGRGRTAGRAGRRHRAIDRSAAPPTRPSPRRPRSPWW